MDDVILDKQSVAAVIGKKGTVKLKVLGWGYYLYNVIIKALIMTLFLSINFCLFAKAGGYSMFGSSILPAPEILNILLSIFCVSFIVMLVLSFSEWLQNLALAFVSALFVVMMINQFALFDKYHFMTSGVMLYLGMDAARFVDGSAYLVVAGAAGLLMLFYLWFSSLSNKFYLAATLFVVNVWILFGAYWDRNNNNNFSYDYDMYSTGEEGGKKFINIYLANASSYDYLNEMKDKNARKNEKLDNLQKVMLGFYKDNNFDIYNNAYVLYAQAAKNQAETLNPLTDEDVLTSSVSHRCCGWQFRPMPDKTDYLTSNRLAKIFQKGQYKVSAYQSRGLDMCRLYGEPVLNRCLNKSNVPADVNVLVSSTGEKVRLLYAQWLESAGLLERDVIRKTAGFLSKNLEKRYDKMYVINSLQAFDLAAMDISQDKGKNAYLIYVDMPADMFVYNEFCQIKPVDEWMAMSDEDFSLQERRSAYAEQYACVFGKIQNFIDSLKSKGLDKNAVIMIQGANSAQDKTYTKDEREILRFGAEHAVTMAIKDPLHPESRVVAEICKTSDIMASYLFKNVRCQEFKGLELDENDRKNLRKVLASQQINDKDFEEASAFFKLWYKYWLKANGFAITKENPTEALSSEKKTIGEENSVVEDIVIVEKNKIIDDVIETEPEVETKSLKEEMLKHPVSEKSETVTKEGDGELSSISVPEVKKSSQSVENETEKLYSETTEKPVVSATEAMKGKTEKESRAEKLSESQEEQSEGETVLQEKQVPLNLLSQVSDRTKENAPSDVATKD